MKNRFVVTVQHRFGREGVVGLACVQGPVANLPRAEVPTQEAVPLNGNGPLTKQAELSTQTAVAPR
jgi:hypothetical protein